MKDQLEAEILDVLVDGTPLTVNEIAMRVDGHPLTVERVCNRLHDDGHIDARGQGRYEVTTQAKRVLAGKNDFEHGSTTGTGTGTGTGTDRNRNRDWYRYQDRDRERGRVRGRFLSRESAGTGRAGPKPGDISRGGANRRPMASEPAPADDDPSLGTVLAALDDTDCRTILRETTEPMTATELIDACDIPRSTLYRKLDHLSSASLVREFDEINPEGGRITRYERDFEDVTISIDDTDELSVAIERPPRRADERLADLWSKMRDEL